MARIRKNDMIEVISGNDRGMKGRVLRVFPDRNRVLVEGVNMRWKHMRKSQQYPQGGRVRREVPIHRSNVMIYDEGAGGRTRVAIRVEGERKIRVARRTGTEIGATPPTEKKKTKAEATKPKAKAKSKAKPATASPDGEE
jgi:large subunit ribosomal protein L24